MVPMSKGQKFVGSEDTPLTYDEIDLKNCLNNRIAQMLREEEIKWYQRAKVKDLLEGDSNTKYFSTSK
jgi:hypothetical protein